MKTLTIQGLETQNGIYLRNDIPVSDFVLSAKKIVMLNPQSTNYQLTILQHNTCHTITLTSSRLKHQRFLPDDLYICDEFEKEFYKLLRKSILEKKFSDDEILYQTNKNGLQKFHKEWIYVCTNGSLSKNGFHANIYSGIAGSYLPSQAVTDREDIPTAIESLFNAYNRNPNVFYPIFLTCLMGITNSYFRELGESNFMKLTLWIDGTSGSGKTELAKAVGCHLFSDDALNKELLSVTGNRRYALERLANSSGSVCILDDVKSERVRERRNKVQNIVDDFIRSVFQGRLTDGGGIHSIPKILDSCAIITGEYLDTNESQNARLLYLKVDDFLKDEKNSKSLRVLQKNPLWLTSVCCGYIEWFLTKASESSFPEFLKQLLQQMRTERTLYDGINNAGRLNENRHMIQMEAKLVTMFFQDMGISNEFINRFQKNAAQSIRAVTDSTFYLLGGLQMVVFKIMENLLKESRVRTSIYDQTSSFRSLRYYQEYFWIWEDDDFIWIDQYRESLLTKEGSGNDAYIDPPCLIIREDLFQRKFQSKIDALLSNNKISSTIADTLKTNLLKILRKMQIIYKQYRSDSKWGRAAVNYPILKTDFDYDGDPFYEISFEPTLQLNTDHPCIDTLKHRLEDEDTEFLLEDFNLPYVNYNEYRDALKARKAFTNGKTLYCE